MRQMNLLQGEKRRDSQKLTGRGQSRVGVKGAASDPLASMAAFRLKHPLQHAHLSSVLSVSTPFDYTRDGVGPLIVLRCC